jgi:hypothetical protein
VNTDDVLATVTHARLRAQQGDVRGARRMLEAILSRRPEDPAAIALIRELSEAVHVETREPVEPDEPAPQPARTETLADRFRDALAPKQDRRRAVARLRAILERIDRVRATGGDGGGDRE